MSGNLQLSYWEEYEAAKAEALKMAAKLSARERGTVVTGLKRGMCNEASHDQTRRRRFERAFRSLDRPDENGVTWDYGDCGRAMKRMLRRIDAPYRERRRALRFAAALDALGGHPALQHTLRAIRRRRRRNEIAAALGISVAAYAKRFTRITRILAPLLR